MKDVMKNAVNDAINDEATGGVRAAAPEGGVIPAPAGAGDNALPRGYAVTGGNQRVWLQVALWCLKRGGPVPRDTIARAFALSSRQAADIMLYITQRRSDVVTSIRVVTVLGGGIRTATIEVTDVRDDALPARGAPSHRRTPGRTLPPELRALMPGRPQGGA